MVSQAWRLLAGVVSLRLYVRRVNPSSAAGTPNLLELGTWILELGACVLLSERGLEHRLLDIRLQVAVRLVDERIRRAGLELRVLLLHVVLRAVVAERHIARQRARHLERPLE